jgi:AraC-like DNA-binding protein
VKRTRSCPSRTRFVPASNERELTGEFMEFVRAQPSGPLRGQVLGYGGYRLDQPCSRRRLEVPSGVVTLMLGLGEPLRLCDPLGRRPAEELTSLVSGMRTSATIGEHTGRVCGVEVMLTPMAAFSILAMPMAALSQQIVDLGAVLGAVGDDLLERLADSPDWRSRFTLLDEVLAARLDVGPRCQPEVARSWVRLWESAGRISVPELVSETGWSRRHLERRFRQQIGLPPKTVAQLVRLQRALRLQDSGMPWARIAVDAGFYDQSHLDRAWREMIGLTPMAFRRERLSARTGGSMDRVPGQVTSVILPE